MDFNIAYFGRKNKKCARGSTALVFQFQTIEACNNFTNFNHLESFTYKYAPKLGVDVFKKCSLQLVSFCLK